jgi:Zn-dependent protease with chaperone function/TPR repeat protein
MSVAQAQYFDGKRAMRHPVTLCLASGRLKVSSESLNAEFDPQAIRVSPRIAKTPRWLYLPDGGACVVDDNKFADRLTREHILASALHELEARPAYAVFTIIFVALVLWLLVDRGVPVIVERIAAYIPVSAEETLGRETVNSLDRYFMHPSQLSPKRQAALREKFEGMARAGGESTEYRIEFRSSPVIGPNAFALPSGIIVMTDELVKLAKNDGEILGVLAHELGHVRYRHTMRRLLEGSVTALVIAGVTGDIASTTSLAAVAPAVLLQSKYSRDNEREADRYAVDLLKRAGMDARYFSAILKRMEENAPKAGTFPSFLSSHPPTKEREALALQGEPSLLPEETEQTNQAAGNAEARPPARAVLAVVDADQKMILALLEKRNFDELERVLGGYQFEFEHNAHASRAVADAFSAFQKAPMRMEAALNEWVEKKPDSYPARVARGNYFVARGWDARGTDYYAGIPAENLAEMRVHLRRATDDLERSLKLTAKPYVSHRTLLTIAKTVGSRREQRAHYDAAIQLAPASVNTRLAYMATLEPRWGGSYEQMEAFLSESRGALQDPKDMAALAARIPAYRGFEKQHADDFTGALVYFDQAISLAASADTLCRRSYVLSKLQRYEEAFRDIGLSLAKDRDDRYCLDMAVYLAPKAADPNDVIRVMDLVIELDPTSTGALNQRGWRYYALGKRDLAFPDYMAAAKLGDAWAQMQVGKFYWHGIGVEPNREEALVWLRKAAQQGNADAKLSLEQALAQTGKTQP